MMQEINDLKAETREWRQRAEAAEARVRELEAQNARSRAALEDIETLRKSARANRLIVPSPEAKESLIAKEYAYDACVSLLKAALADGGEVATS